MHTARTLALCALLAISALACEKDASSTGKPSGALAKTESSLLAYVPGSTNVIFGGNYEKFMKHWKTSPLKKLSELAAKMTGDENAIRDYMTCWIEKAGDSSMAGGMSLSGGGIAMSMVFDKVTPEIFEACTKQAGYTVKRDDDGKYLELQGIPDGRGGTTNAGYYFVAEDTAYFAMEANMMGVPKVLGRGDLEARIEQTKGASAVDSAALQALMKKADRSKAFWFVGSAAGTPATEFMAEGHGWIDMSASALSFGFTVELAQAELAKQAVEGYEQAKAQVDGLPPQFAKPIKQLIENTTLKASGKTLTGRVELTNSIVEELLPAMSMFGGGL